MALIVEDGTGKSDAESFISVADADTYHSNRANTAWAALTTANKEAYLRRATDYMEQVYRMRWFGFRKTTTQALDWPRINVMVEDIAVSFMVSTTIVPTEVKNACAEMALKASTATLAADIQREKVRTKVGPIEVEYRAGGVQFTKYRAIDNMLKIYLQPSSSKMVRS
jgi:hypothetical protein